MNQIEKEGLEELTFLDYLVRGHAQTDRHRQTDRHTYAHTHACAHTHTQTHAHKHTTLNRSFVLQAYIPLFLDIHDAILDNPLDDSCNRDFTNYNPSEHGF